MVLLALPFRYRYAINFLVSYLATQELRLRELLGTQAPMVIQERKLRGSVPLVPASPQRGMPRDLRPPSPVFQG